MGFAINPSLNHIDVPEKYILEIHQSSSEVVLPDARFRGHPCEAFICITKVEKEMKAYVAVLNNALKSTLIYTSDFVATSQQDYPKVLHEAEVFVKAMGFAMQKVNLDFSPAMREVIIKGLRIMRPPAPQKRPPVKHLKIDVPDELVVSTGLNEPQVNEDAGSMTELLSLKAELASVRAALERAAREKVTAEQHRSGEKAALKASCEQALESRKLSEEKLAQAVREIKKLQQSQQAAPASGDLQQLRQQLDQAMAAGKALEIARTELVTELKTRQEELSRLNAEKVQLEKRLDGEIEKRSAIEAEWATVRQKFEQRLAMATAEGAAATEKMAALSAVEDALREAQQRENDLKQKLSLAVAELAAASAEKEELLVSKNLAEQFRVKLSRTDAELAATMEKLALAETETRRLMDEAGRADELQQRLAVTEAELTRAREDIGELNSSVKTGADIEHRLAEASAELVLTREQLAAASTEIEQLRLEQGRATELQHRLVEREAELAAARLEIEQMEIPEAVMESVDQSADEQLARLAVEKEAVEAEYVRLATESRATESELSENLTIARAEVERLASELEIQAQVAAMEQAALRAELRRLIVEGGAALYATAVAAEPQRLPQAVPVAASQGMPAPQQPVVVQQVTQPPPAGGLTEHIDEAEEEDDAPDSPIPVEAVIMQEFTSDLGGFYGGNGGSATEFRMDQSINMINYSDPADVVVVFYSSNSVQAVPEGKGIQKCKGYIIALKGAEGYRVYVAWYLTESGRVVVCLPEQQPADSDECVQILKDAVSYFEIVGFMMEIAELGGTRRSYLKGLKKIPVLKKIAA